MLSRIILFVMGIALVVSPVHDVLAQSSSSQIDLTLIGGYAGPKVVPFWLRSNQFGSIPLEGGSGSLLLRASRPYSKGGNSSDSSSGNTKWDWGYALEGRMNVGKRVNAQLIDAHVKVRYTMLEAKLGRTKDVMGLNGDTLLSSGNFAVSGNALGVPVLDLRIADYYRLPVLGGIISLKANFANGYIGKMAVDSIQFLNKRTDYNLSTIYHQKSLYGRIGKSNWKVNFYGGINHQAQYGGERQVYGNDYTLSTLETLWYVMWGKAYGGRGSSIPSSKLGNQQGSVDLGFTYDWENVQLMGYRQNFYDVGAISKLANIKDGLNGVTLTNKQFNKKASKWDWHKVLVEFFYSKDQAGYPWSKPTRSGDEDYYNNYYYLEGWSYKGMGIGSPLIVTANSVKPGQANYPKDYFISNRVVAGHLGYRGLVEGWLVNVKLTAAKHYGTFATSEFGKSTGRRFGEPYKDRFVPVAQFSGYLQAEKVLKNNLYLGFTVAGDYGKLFYNSGALQVSLRKSFAY